jgi:hemolysin activation/secretion protein
LQPIGSKRGATIRVRGGIASADDISQLAFRAGGMESVRGFSYGAERGQAFWAVQSDVTPFKGIFRPVLFVDAGQAARPADLGDTPVLVGGGVGFSLFEGIVRFDLSHPITPSHGGVRFDLVIRGVR